jgi:type VI secretion system protein ImpE
MYATEAADTLKAGDPLAALGLLQEQVRAEPADAKLRIFLFQLLAVLGQWERALAQLDVLGRVDAGALAMVHTYRDVVKGEALRARVFAGEIPPMILGEPQEWMGLLIEALAVAGQGRREQSLQNAKRLRDQAFEHASPSAGTIDGRAFAWIADADSRLGPVLEAMVNGTYYWIPFSRLTRVALEPPADLRDAVWIPAHLDLINGGEAAALIPTRYPGSESSQDGEILLARKTLWQEVDPETFHGLGQRLFATDFGEVALMDARQIHLDNPPAAEPEAGGG